MTIGKHHITLHSTMEVRLILNWSIASMLILLFLGRNVKGRETVTRDLDPFRLRTWPVIKSHATIPEVQIDGISRLQDS